MRMKDVAFHHNIYLYEFTIYLSIYEGLFVFLNTFNFFRSYIFKDRITIKTYYLHVYCTTQYIIF